MEIVPLGPGFAAELLGVTLADVAGDDHAYRQTRAAFEEHSVLVFRDQDVTDEMQMAFSCRFGPLEVSGKATPGAGTNLVILTTLDKDGKVVPADHRLCFAQQSQPAVAHRLFVQEHTGACLGAVGTACPRSRRRNRICFDPSRLGPAGCDDAENGRKFVCLARLQPFTRQDRPRSRRCRRTRGLAAAVLAWRGRIR